MYWYFINKEFKKPTSENKWMEKLNFQFEEEVWMQIYSMSYHITRDTKLQSFQRKITHRIFPCNFTLKKWCKVESETCNFCNNSIDDILHCFIQCDSVLYFGETVLEWWFNISETRFQLEYHELLFGVFNLNEYPLLDVLNYLLLLVKWFIHYCKKNGLHMSLAGFLKQLKNNLELEQYIMYKNGSKEDFDRKWMFIYVT